MNVKQSMRAEIQDLLAYFPGRGRVALVWLVLIPIFAIVPSTYIFGNTSQFPTDGIPYPIFAAVGRSVLWIYLPSVFVCLIRVTKSQRSSLRNTGLLVLSSVFYGVLIGLPAVVVTAIGSMFYLGISVTSIIQGVVGIIAVLMSVVLVVIMLGVAAHYLGFFSPLLLLLVKAHLYFLPIAYPLPDVPGTLRTVQTLVLPLAPAITIMRNAVLNSTVTTPVSCWVGAAVHVAGGFAVMVWLWRRISKPGGQQK
jgi:lipopolysaccharide transport system permease protein